MRFAGWGRGLRARAGAGAGAGERPAPQQSAAGARAGCPRARRRDAAGTEAARALGSSQPSPASRQVILDVVFNHTAEGNECGPTISMRGLDNRVYYMLAPGEASGWGWGRGICNAGRYDRKHPTGASMSAPRADGTSVGPESALIEIDRTLLTPRTPRQPQAASTTTTAAAATPSTATTR
jgi:hypothetical protein